MRLLPTIALGVALANPAAAGELTPDYKEALTTIVDAAKIALCYERQYAFGPKETLRVVRAARNYAISLIGEHETNRYATIAIREVKKAGVKKQDCKHMRNQLIKAGLIR